MASRPSSRPRPRRWWSSRSFGRSRLEDSMLRNLKRALLGLGLAGLPLVASAQEKRPAAAAPSKVDPATWVESRFHRVHLKNGNFIDGDLIRKDQRLVVLKLKAGDFGIR